MPVFRIITQYVLNTGTHRIRIIAKEHLHQQSPTLFTADINSIKVGDLLSCLLIHGNDVLLASFK